MTINSALFIFISSRTNNYLPTTCNFQFHMNIPGSYSPKLIMITSLCLR